MKRHRIIPVMGFLFAVSPLHPVRVVGAEQEVPQTATAVERISDSQLERLREAKRPFAHVPTATAEPAAERSFADASDFLVFDGNSTFVPKNAILHVPESLKPHIVAAPTGTLMLWRDFLARNTARIAPFEVTLEEASGSTSIDSDRIESAARSGRILVAVTRGFPISVSRK
jgi:hypothetical protein